MLYQLSYAHHECCVMVRLRGLEPLTHGLEVRCSVQLSYRRKEKRGRSVVVGARGFEPPTPCAQGRCATRLRYTPTLESARLIAKDRRPEAGSEYRFRSHEVSIFASCPVRTGGPALTHWIV